jgi:site-specific recombinase XerD
MKTSKSSKKGKTKLGKERTALVPRQASDPALANAVAFWTDATTSGSSLRRRDIKRDKSNAVLSFFGFTGKHPAAVTASDVKQWQVEMKEKGLAQTTVYTRICHLSSFFRWAMKDSLVLRQNIIRPVFSTISSGRPPLVAMMQSSDFGDLNHRSTLRWLLRSRLRRILTQR